ncbi:zinc finger protein 28-like isoform X11 [Aricia agestis]|uniref:zinc finger protein 28-like isoform X11 n=1 Tax=Aricia agestis TaxID=91739 RepID=UPI001C2065E3|nr:zinc finger protein 28-like isoform X11 [Aricia agestis]
MEPKTIEWRPGPAVCRCCLAEGCYKDISTEYFWMGKREVYAEMLSETLDLSIAYSTSGGPNSNSRLICEQCISKLRDATEFKRQVQECERTFIQWLDPGNSVADATATEVKLEQVKKEKNHNSDEDDDFNDQPDFGDDDGYDDLDDDVPLTKYASKTPKKEPVDLQDLLDNVKPTTKRKSTTTKDKSTAKKAKVSKEKATSSKPKPEKKKKGNAQQTITDELLDDKGKPTKHRSNKRSAKAEARFMTKKNATSILACWSLTPFKWKTNKFQCAYCEEQFMESHELRCHVRACYTHKNVKDIYKTFKEMTLINVDVTNAACQLCEVPFSSVDHMREHAIEHGFDLNLSYSDGILPFRLDNPWKCVLCDIDHNNYLKLYEHMNCHYQNYICSTCGKAFMDALRLRKHTELHVIGNFPCKVCNLVFPRRRTRDSHARNFHKKGPRYECPLCNLRFVGYYHRMKHLKDVHDQKETSYKCLHCDLSFKTSGMRSRHVRLMHFLQHENFSCDYCELSFQTGYELRKHLLKHTVELVN